MPYIAVIGAVNIDIWARSYEKLRARDSNPGAVRLSQGGVGRNIAHNLRLLDVPVKLLTVLGGDGFAGEIESSCAHLGVDMSHSLKAPEAHTGCYVAISGPEGDMELAVSDMDATALISPEYVESRAEVINGARLVVCDANLRRDTFEALTALCRAPLFADTVSAAKARRIAPFLGFVHTLKPNRLEAEALTGEADPRRAARALLDAGVKRVYITGAGEGMTVGEGERITDLPAFPARVANATGGGDAAMAALCRAYCDGLDALSSARFALAAGSLAVECEDTINPSLCLEAVARRLRGE